MPSQRHRRTVIATWRERNGSPAQGADCGGGVGTPAPNRGCCSPARRHSPPRSRGPWRSTRRASPPSTRTTRRSARSSRCAPRSSRGSAPVSRRSSASPSASSSPGSRCSSAPPGSSRSRSSSGWGPGVRVPDPRRGVLVGADGGALRAAHRRRQRRGLLVRLRRADGDRHRDRARGELRGGAAAALLGRRAAHRPGERRARAAARRPGGRARRGGARHRGVGPPAGAAGQGDRGRAGPCVDGAGGPPDEPAERAARTEGTTADRRARFRALERVAWYTTDLTELVARSGPVAENLGGRTRRSRSRSRPRSGRSPAWSGATARRTVPTSPSPTSNGRSTPATRTRRRSR